MMHFQITIFNTFANLDIPKVLGLTQSHKCFLYKRISIHSFHFKINSYSVNTNRYPSRWIYTLHNVNSCHKDLIRNKHVI